MSRYPIAQARFPTIRQSRGVAFDACALSAKLDADYRSHWSGHPQVRGSIMHRVFAEALRRMAAADENRIPTDVVIGILADALRQDDIDRECPECGGVIISTIPDTGETVCAHGHRFRGDFGNIPMSEIKDMRWVAVKWATDNTFDMSTVVDIEHRLRAAITYPDGQGGHVERILTGQLDALFIGGEREDEAIVLDWKDSWALPAPTEVGFDGYAQQRWYAWLVMKNYPVIQKVTLREFYVRYSQYREASVLRSELDGVEQDLSALAERFDRAWHENKFPPTPGRHCGWCARPEACPILSSVRGDGAITDDATAKKVAAEAIVAKAVLKQREAALKAWTSVRGPVPIRTDAGRERQWGHVERQRVSRPTRDEMEVALRRGRPNLGELYKTTTHTRFEVHSPGPVEDTADDAALLNALEASIEQQENDQAA